MGPPITISLIWQKKVMFPSYDQVDICQAESSIKWLLKKTLQFSIFGSTRAKEKFGIFLGRCLGKL